MRTANNFGKDALKDAITNVEQLREFIRTEQDNYQESDLLYNVRSLLGELNQYFGGGYLSTEYMTEKCNTIKAISEAINKDVFG